MTLKLSASGEWLVPYADIPSSGPIEKASKGKTGLSNEGNLCFECCKSYRNCECKCCLKCGSPFLKYFGTNLIKGRSHCRSCFSPVCLTCIVLIKGLQKVCTRCHLKQKEDEISTEKALSAIGEAKFGSCNAASLTKLKTQEQKKLALFEAARNGYDHIMVTLINMGIDINSKDSDGNTPLFSAVEGGYLPCVALLLEKGANVRAVNNVGWTPLHSVAWKGSTESHLDCAELLLEMGGDILKETDTGETAADLAARCGGSKKMMQILRAAEVEVLMEVLEEKSITMIDSAASLKEKKYAKMILAVLRYFRESAPLQLINKEQPAKKLMLPSQTLNKTTSLNSKLTFCSSCQTMKCQTSKPNAIPLSNDINGLKSDSDTNIRPIGSLPPINQKINVHILEAKKNELEKEIEKLRKEKNEWEGRSRKLMQSIAVSTKEHEKLVGDLEQELNQLKEENTLDISKIEAAQENKLAKVRMEHEALLLEKEQELYDSEEARLDLLQIQKHYKLTWIPDDAVKLCQYASCMQPFSKTVRKHHCRLCGRIFCSNCTRNKQSLRKLGYTKPVRVCSMCYLLLEDTNESDEDLELPK